MLDRLRRTTWNWLPSFLEVAETGSVVAASKRLGLTPAAVSRTLGLLEDALGEQLFNRVGRSLTLNAHGAALRDAVRAAQRAIDGGLAEALGDPFGGPLRVASIGVVTDSFVVPALADLKVAYPQLLPDHLNLGAREANAMLARGQLDVAFYYEELTADGIVLTRLGALSASVYCGRAHPLFARRRIARDELLAHPFSVPQIGDTGRVMDGWPADLPRRIGMRITTLRSNLQVCLSGALLTVLPDVTAAPHLPTRELRRLPAPRLPPIDIFAAHHASATPRGSVAHLIAAVRARLARLSSSAGAT